MPLGVVLAVGSNLPLMSTRILVLRSAGYIVESASSLQEAVDRFHLGDFDIVLLCHSVPMEDRERLATSIRATGSLTPIVSIASKLGECDAFANATLEDGPNKFLVGIREALSKAANDQRSKRLDGNTRAAHSQ